MREQEYSKEATASPNERPYSTFDQAHDQAEDYRSFAELLDHYLPEALKPGQLVEGQILRVSREGIIVDIGAKRDAIVPKQEATD